ncbi:MAG: MFS transporter [Candidatus Micrarchaeota archaeon]
MPNWLKLDKNVTLLGIVSMLTDVSSEMIFPLVPIFLTSVLGAPVALLGVIEGVAEATADLLKMASGVYSDKIGKRKPFVLAGYGLSTIVKPIFALSMAWPEVLSARVLDRVGKGLRGSARDAMIADYSDDKTRGRAFGFRKMMDSLGATIGPLIAFILLPILLAHYGAGNEGSAYRAIFALAVIPAAFAVLVLFFVKEKENGAKIKGWKFDLSGFTPALKANLAVSLFFSLGTYSYAFFVLRAQDAGMAVVAIPLAYMFFNFIYSLSAIPAGSLSDIIGRRAVIMLGYFLFAITSFGFGFANSDIAIWFMFATYGIFMAIIESVQRAYVSDLAPKEFRGTALGMYQGAIGLAALPASVIAGLLWEVEVPVFGINSRATFLFGGAIALISIVAFFSFVREK